MVFILDTINKVTWDQKILRKEGGYRPVWLQEGGLHTLNTEPIR